MKIYVILSEAYTWKLKFYYITCPLIWKAFKKSDVYHQKFQ